jgi:hypothetical protein
MGIELALMAAAAAASAYNTQRTAKKQDRALANKIRTQSRKQQEADSRVNAELDQMGRSSPAQDRAAALAEYVNQVRANAGRGTALGSQLGNVSNAYAKAADDAAMGVASDTSELAGLMATQDGVTRQRDREGRAMANLGTDLGLVRREADGLAYLDDLRINGIRRNPWIDAASQALSGLAGGMGAGAGRAAGSASASAATRAGLGNVAGIGAGLAGGTRYGPQVNDPFARYGLGGRP